MKKISVFLIIFFLTFIGQAGYAQFDAEEALEKTTHLDKSTVDVGFTIYSKADFLKLGFPPNSFSDEITVHSKIYGWIADKARVSGWFSDYVLDHPVPFGKHVVGDILEYTVTPANAEDEGSEVWVAIKYFDDDGFPKRLHYWSDVQQTWVELPSVDNKELKEVQAAVNFKTAKLAILSMEADQGEASWYRWRDCNCAASRDYPKGSLLKVTNLHNPEKTVVVTVNDYGPEAWTGRIIDLDKVAFSQLASPGIGLLDVRVEKLPGDSIEGLE